jgi:hypothetical protein
MGLWEMFLPCALYLQSSSDVHNIVLPGFSGVISLMSSLRTANNNLSLQHMSCGMLDMCHNIRVLVGFIFFPGLGSMGCCTIFFQIQNSNWNMFNRASKYRTVFTVVFAMWKFPELHKALATKSWDRQRRLWPNESPQMISNTASTVIVPWTYFAIFDTLSLCICIRLFIYLSLSIRMIQMTRSPLLKNSDR